MALVEIEDGNKVKAMLEDIFSDGFMKKNTNFDSFRVFCYSSAVFANWDGGVIRYMEERLDDFVRESTIFSDFDEMVRQAADERYSKKQDARAFH